MRLIDADELIKAIEQGEGFSWDSHGKDDLCVRKKYIDNALTVAPERQPGEWVEDMHDCYYHCSVCGHATEEADNFCPSCGADMRGEE